MFFFQRQRAWKRNPGTRHNFHFRRRPSLSHVHILRVKVNPAQKRKHPFSLASTQPRWMRRASRYGQVRRPVSLTSADARADGQVPTPCSGPGSTSWCGTRSAPTSCCEWPRPGSVLVSLIRRKWWPDCFCVAYTTTSSVGFRAAGGADGFNVTGNRRRQVQICGRWLLGLGLGRIGWDGNNLWRILGGRDALPWLSPLRPSDCWGSITF
jgi:hypothetical protein